LRDDKRGYRGDRLANGRGDQPAVLRQKTIGVGALTQPNRVPIPGLKAKDLVGAPWRVALALQGFATIPATSLAQWADWLRQAREARDWEMVSMVEERIRASVWLDALSTNGWYLRQDIIWQKPNPMPESVTDRCTKAHEYIFLLSKSERYYYDQEAILEPASENTHARVSQDVEKQIGSARANGGTRSDRPMKAVMRSTKPVAGWDTGPGGHSTIGHNQPKDDGDERKLLRDVGVGDRARPRKAVPNRKDLPETQAKLGDYRDEQRKLATEGSGIKNNESFDQAMAIMPTMRNKRSVWTVPTEGFKEAHFATFPTALIEPCILAGCPAGGTVLDPFGGAGTTGLVADRHQRNAILIELNPEYAAMAERRIVGDAPLFAEVHA
jgi:DNA modification methylase